MKVLLVDDDATALLIASSVIRRIEAAEPTPVASPLQALDWLKENTPDLLNGWPPTRA